MALNSSASFRTGLAVRSDLRRGLPVKLVVKQSGKLRVLGHEPALDIEQCLSLVITQHAPTSPRKSSPSARPDVNNHLTEREVSNMRRLILACPILPVIAPAVPGQLLPGQLACSRQRSTQW